MFIFGALLYFLFKNKFYSPNKLDLNNQFYF